MSFEIYNKDTDSVVEGGFFRRDAAQKMCDEHGQEWHAVRNLPWSSSHHVAHPYRVRSQNYRAKAKARRSAMDDAADACGLIKVRSDSGKVYYE